MLDRLIYSIDILKCDVLINHCQTLIYNNIIRFIFIGSDEDAIFFIVEYKMQHESTDQDGWVSKPNQVRRSLKKPYQYLSKIRSGPFFKSGQGPTLTRADRLKRSSTVPDRVHDLRSKMNEL